MRLIDEKALINEAATGGWDVDIKELKMILKHVETISDVPVVRCGDCKYGTWLESCQRRRCDYWTCFRNGMVYGRANTVNENDYCSYGANMEDKPCG